MKKLLVKYVLTIYALGSAHEKFEAVPKRKFSAELGGRNG